MDEPVAGAAVVDAGAAVEAPDFSAMDDMEVLNAPDPEPVVEETPAEVDPVVQVEKTEEEKAAEAAEKTDEEKLEEAEKTEEEKAAEAAKKPEEGKVETPEEMAVKAIKDRINKNPALKAELDKPENLGLRNTIYAMARRSEQLNGYRQVLPTLEDAKQAKSYAEDLVEIETDYEAGTAESYDALIQRMWDAQVERDPKSGEPLKDGQGNIRNSGRWAGFFHHYRNTHFWPVIEKQFEGNEEVIDAMRVLRTAVDGEPDGAAPVVKGRQAASTQDDEKRLTAEERQLIADGKTRQRETEEHKATEAKQFVETVRTSVEDGVTGFLLQKLGKMAPAIPEKLRAKIAGEALAEINGIAKADPLYQNSLKNLMRAKAENTKDLAKAKAIGFAETRATAILQRLVGEYSAPVIEKNAATRTKLEEQAGRTEVKGGGGASTPTRPDEATMTREADKLSQQLYGRRLRDVEILDIEGTLERLQKEAKKRQG